MTTSFNDNDIAEWLQQQTESLQHEVINSPFNQALAQENLPLRLYIGQLEAYLAIYRTLETQLKNYAHPIVRAVWRSNMARTAILEQDLLNFQADIPTAPVQRAMSAFVHYAEKIGQAHPLGLLGITYALHRSEWETRHLLVHLQRILAEQNSLQNKGVAYYSAYNGENETQWYEFQQRLNQAVIEAQDKHKVAIYAEEAFEYIKNLLKALWQSR